jgi:catechol 2,3-dioxygenase-like lactoylglutathione lyase family enzyme
MTGIAVRYIVDDAEAAVAFYRDRLGFEVKAQPGPGFAILAREGARLLLSEPRGAGGAAQPTPDGRRPEPGGWNRIQLEVDDVDAAAEMLRRAGVQLRSDVIRGRGGSQVLVEDPSGNPVELFEPAR